MRLPIFGLVLAAVLVCAGALWVVSRSAFGRNTTWGTTRKCSACSSSIGSQRASEVEPPTSPTTGGAGVSTATR